LFLLSVISVRSVLSQVMLVKKLLLHGFDGVARQRKIMPCHEGNLLKNDRVVNRVIRIRSPRERSVTVNKNRRHIIRLNSALNETLDNHGSGLLLIGARNLSGSHSARTGNLPIEII